MELYDINDLRYNEYIDTPVYVKFTSKHDSYEGKAILKATNRHCCLIINKKHQIFNIYFDDCLDGKMKVIDKETEETTEIFRISTRKPNPFHTYGKKSVTEPLIIE